MSRWQTEAVIGTSRQELSCSQSTKEYEAMFGSLARIMYRRRRLVVGVWVVVLVLSMALASQVNKVLGPGTFTIPGSDAAKASAILDKQFNQNDQKVTVVAYQNPHLLVTDAAFGRAVADAVARIRADHPLQVNYLDNPLVSHNAQLISRDHHAVIVTVSSRLGETKLEAQIDHLRTVAHIPGFKTYVLGTAAANRDYALQQEKDLSRADSITVPIMLLILLLVFGTLVAAALPLVLAGFSIALSLALVFIFAHFFDTSIYVTSVVTFLGLGVAIDYTLFIVYRFRDELIAAGGDREQAVVRTMETTGRAVFFSGLTVAIALSSLILTQVSFMETMGLGGMVVPLTALLVAMTLLPALLGFVGPNINRFRVLPRRFLASGNGRAWHRIASAVMARPIVSGGAVLVLMLSLAYPLTQMNFAFGSLKNAPQNLESVAGYNFMKSHFTTTSDPTQITIQHLGPGTLLAADEVAGMRTLEQDLRLDPGVARVIGPADFIPTNSRPTAAERAQLTGRYLTADSRTGIISVTPRHEVGTKANEDMVKRVRDLAHQYADAQLRGDTIHVGGASANYLAFDEALYAKFPLIIASVLILTYIFLFFAFRSVFLPLKAVLLNLLSVGAAYGMLQLVFQQGIGSSVLGFSPESGIAEWVPLFLFAFLFGLSMDYEVFLLSRMRERWLETGDNRESVAHGIEKTGRLISSAAGIMVIAFAGLLIGHEIQMKEFGFGLMASIAIDATLIRVVLVPAIMELMGNANWWVPGFLHRFAQSTSPFAEQDAEVSERISA
ncbi:MAG TPA: MMPL family transporter [Chloroflexota bacterium]